jgi:DNA-binding LacI/PurR family transcriptional regulator
LEYREVVPAVKKKVTINDIAHRADVSPRTVSRVLANDANVGAITRKRILDIAREEGFSVNMLARGLKTRKNKLIIAFAGGETYWGSYYTSLFAELIREARRLGYQMVIAAAGNGGFREKDDSILKLLKFGLADGAILCDVKDDDQRIAYFEKNDIPFVSIAAHEGDSSVEADNRALGSMGAAYLYDKGKRDIVFLLGSKEYTLNRRRGSGFAESFGGGRSDARARVIYGVDDIDRAYETTRGLLEDKGPDAIFISGDEEAMGVFRAIKERGLSIPRDIGVLGLDNGVVNEYLVPRLTTIELSPHLLARYAFAVIYSKLEEGDKSLQQVTLTPQLVERGSV